MAMSSGLATLAVIVALVLLLVAGIRVGVALAALGVAVLALASSLDVVMSQLAVFAYQTLASDTLAAVPLYVLMAQILMQGGVGKDLFNLAGAALGRVPGGLGISTVGATSVFAAISGSSSATAATVGMVSIPEMIAQGYSRRFSTGLVAAAGTLGILIPPSIPLILYGAITDTSVGKLYELAFVPGLILAGMLCAYSLVASWGQRGERYVGRVSWGERLAALKEAAYALVFPLVILGGIYTGFFTPTEAAAVGVVIALLVTMVFKRTLSLKGLAQSLLITVRTTCMITLIVVGAVVLGHAMTLVQVPQQLVAVVAALPLPVIAIVAAMNVLVILLGMVLEVISLLYIAMPLLAPVLLNLHVSLYWFAILFVVNMEIALIHPPVGVNLYIIQGVARESNQVPAMDVIRGVLPFLGLMLCYLAALIVWTTFVSK